MTRKDAANYILTSARSVAGYTTDYGRIRHPPPAAVGVPSTVIELQQCLEYAGAHDLKLVTRGGAYSFLGQSLAADHMIVDLKRLDSDRPRCRLNGDLVDVTAGMKLWDVQDRLTATGSRLPVMTSAGGATIGGTLAIGGLSGRSYRRGFLVQHVREFSLLGTDGKIRTCNPAENALLYNTALACQGMLGFVLDAKISHEPLLPFRARVVVNGIPARLMYSVAKRLRDYPEVSYLEGYVDWADIEPMAQVHATIEAATAEEAQQAQQRWREIMAEQSVVSYDLDIFDIGSPIRFSASIGGWNLTMALEADRTANTTQMLLPLGFLLRESDAVSAFIELGDYARTHDPMFIGSSYFSMLDAMSDQQQIWAQLDDHSPWVMGIDMLLHSRRPEVEEMLKQADEVWTILSKYNVRTYPYGSMPRGGMLHTLTPEGIGMMREAASITDPDRRLLHRDLIPEIDHNCR